MEDQKNALQVSQSSGNSQLETAASIRQQDEMFEALLSFGAKMIKSSFTPLKKAEDVAVAVLLGQSLGIDKFASIQGIYAVDGKAAVGTHIANAILTRAGVITEILKDFAPLYAYQCIDVSKAIYSEDVIKENPDSFQIITVATPKDNFIVGKKQVIKSFEPIDWITTVKMTRWIDTPVGVKEVTHTRSRKFSDYIHLHSKTNWKNNPADMLMARVTGIVGRLIAPDGMNGIYLQSELIDLPDGTKTVDIESYTDVTNVDKNFSELSSETVNAEPVEENQQENNQQ